jgi:lipopolysaccharide/colanic/teichoic acid biosynthesis glycosyltransferase
VEDAGEIRQVMRNDARLTRIGRLLRRTSIDELPQLINVLRGEMSLVGPRPHAAAHNSHYERLIADYAFRHHVKPGLSGWAQVNGFRGETDTALMQQRVDFDLWYIDNWSLWLDLKIIVKTLWILLRQPAAY